METKQPTREQIKKDWLDRVLIIRHAVIKKEGEFDDQGYCERKIPWGGSIYWMGVADRNGELMCAECALTTLLRQLPITGTIPTYKDMWSEDWNVVIKHGVV